MPCSDEKQLENHSAGSCSTLVKPLAPEEIRPGDFVTLLHVICELPSFLWCADSTLLPVDEPVRIQYVPFGGGKPLRVESVCLPFVLVRRPSGKKRTLDVRTCRLARLDNSFAKVTWKARKKAHKKKVRACRNGR